MIHLDAIAIRQGTFRLGPVSLAVPAGGYVALMGPTGCGKTSLIEVVAGLRSPAAGRVRLRGTNATDWPPAARGLGYVPQDAAVFRTLTVRENLAFALRVRESLPGRAELGGVVTPSSQRASQGESETARKFPNKMTATYLQSANGRLLYVC